MDMDGDSAAGASGEASVGVADSGRIAYIELPVADSTVSAAFFTAAFGWDMVRFGPSYAATVGHGTDMGLDAGHADAPQIPLPGIRVGNLESALAAVRAAGGVITRPIFAFPGGRRFQFREPGGNELAAFVEESGGTAAD